ncbi:hypothetical protein AB0910_03080 [Streptomyces sp. NPDC047002]|uniref:hypothetical protein n=1 Tax=Streptomyces sp. NPDC047002 TaxID=3155475 RepID=UPI003454A554
MAGHAFACVPSLGLSASVLNGSGTPGVFEMRPLSGLDLSSLPVVERGGNERPTKAPEAGVAARATAYADAAAGAGAKSEQYTHDHTMWAFRGPQPWSYPA